MKKSTLLLLMFIGVAVGQKSRAISSSSSRRVRLPGKSAVVDFNCPEDFGYYPHASDCSQYYVCVFGGALLESCTGGLMYSNELQTCDWPRNVICSLSGSGSGVSTVRITDPRTQGSTRPVTEPLTPSVSNNVGRRLDNTIQDSRFPSRHEESKSSNRFFSPSTGSSQSSFLFNTRDSFVQETTNRVNVISTTKPPVFPPSSQPRVTTTTDKFSIYSDYPDNGDSDYYYYYDDELTIIQEFYDTLGSNTPTTPPSRLSNTKPSSSSSRQTQRKPSSSSSRSSASTDSSTPQRIKVPTLKPRPASSKVTTFNDIWKHPPKRPTPTGPQPPVDSPASKCDPKVCRLPDCYCGGKTVPGGISPPQVPQIVLLTFDDSVNDLNRKLYQELFERGRKNPNGCPISATFYISHEWTDYSQVQNLYADGHEIASHSITHSFGEQFSTSKWAKEIAGQREILSAYGGVRMEDVRGMRAPFLAIGGNKMFKMLHEQNFTYDSSMPVYENKPPSWPYTLDYHIFHDCMIPPCPTKSYPGVWEVPMVMWQDLNGGRCSMGDACTTPPDAEGVYKMLIENFERHYTSNRAPFGLYYHAAWFTTPHHKDGFVAFLDTITSMDDVWIITNWQALQWVRDPVPLSQLHSYKPWQCEYPERPRRCSSAKVCNVWHKTGVRYMRTCQQCPDVYPWTGKTGVPSSLNDV